MEKSDKSKSSHASIDQLAMDIIHIKYQSIWNRLQINNTRKWTYWEFNYISKTPQTLFPLQKRGLVSAVLATASDTSHYSFLSLAKWLVKPGQTSNITSLFLNSSPLEIWVVMNQITMIPFPRLLAPQNVGELLQQSGMALKCPSFSGFLMWSIVSIGSIPR